MIDKVMGGIIFWLLMTIIPIFAVWTMGIPVYGFTFWFDEEGVVVCVGWFWLMGFLTLMLASDVD